MEIMDMLPLQEVFSFFVFIMTELLRRPKSFKLTMFFLKAGQGSQVH